MSFNLYFLFILTYYAYSIARILKPIVENDYQSMWRLNTSQRRGVVNHTDVKDVHQHGSD